MAHGGSSSLLGALGVLLASSSALVVPPSTRRPDFGDPLGLHARQPPPSPLRATAAAGALLPLLGGSAAARADFLTDVQLANPSLDPRSFQPVCPASDGFYRFSQQLVVGLVGQENVKEYAPLVAGGLLRVRLELCVVESFLYEAIIPFIKENGLSWVLPLHETVETFLAGVIFAVASNFILIGSTKLITVIFTYGDILVGFPCRLVGNAGWRSLEERAAPPPSLPEPEKPKDVWSVFSIFTPKPKPNPPSIEAVVRANKDEPKQAAQLAVWGSLRAAGELSKGVRIFAESLDTFVGRYLLLTTVAYVGIKFVHYKIFDPIPF